MAGQINIGDTWKNISAMNINIGDTWKSVVAAQINIGDSWKTWWPTTPSIDGKYIYLYNSAAPALNAWSIMSGRFSAKALILLLCSLNVIFF